MNNFSNKQDQKQLMSMINSYSFMVNELNLFLDTHPNSERAKTLSLTFKTELAKLKDYYNSNFTPLTKDCISNESYITGPWPWEDRF